MHSLELHLDLVFRFGIGQYFLGILPTDTEGKLGKDFSVLCLWRERTHQRSQLHPPHTIDKKTCVFSQEDDHDDVFKRGRASCSANMIPIKTPPKKRLSTKQLFPSSCRLCAQHLHVTLTQKKIVCLLSEMTHDDPAAMMYCRENKHILHKWYTKIAKEMMNEGDHHLIVRHKALLPTFEDENDEDSEANIDVGV